MYNNKKRDYEALANNLLENIENILHGWLQDGKRVGNEYKALNPTRSDSKVGSFSVNLKNGKWSDFATGDVGGNLITLYAYLFGCKNSEAYDTLTGEDNNFTNYTQHNYIKKTKEALEEWKLLSLPRDEPSGEHYQLGMPYAMYKYEDFYIFRYLKKDGTKDIRPMTYRENVTTGEKSWRWKAKENNRSLYNKQKINNDMPVLIVEGEKAGNVIVAGYITVSWAGGSNAIEKTDWTPLVGRDDVYLWADRDKAGLKTVGKIQSILPKVKIIPIDFSIGDGQDIADITHREVQDKLQYFIQSQTVEVEKVKPKEIVVRYDTKYPEIKRIDSGIIIARTGAGKTFNYEGVAEYLIIVPRAEQITVEAGENGNFLIDKILDSGAIITFNKFYGHYNNNPEFREMIDKKIIKVVVDEAHLLVAVPSRMHKLIYNLDHAVFMSGTLETFFREDLQRYKYVPSESETIYYTDDFIPKIDGSLIFADNKKALVKNYPNNCVVSKNHKHKCVNVATTKEKYVIATSCLREGISVKNDNFRACVVYAKGCNLWSTKDILQGVHRVRENCLRLVTKKPDEQYTKYINFNWWLKFVNENSSDDVALNAVFGEYYSNLIRITHKQNKYVKADEYGIACYLSHLTRNNYDKDFYNFVELTELTEEFKINLDTKGIKEDEDGENGKYETKDGIVWEFDIKKKPKFIKWVESYESGLVDKIAKLNSFKNFKDIYERSMVAKYIKKSYNQTNKKRGKKYSIDMFYKLLKELVQFEMIDDKTGKKVERIGAKNSHKNVSIKVVENHPDYIRKSNKK